MGDVPTLRHADQLTTSTWNLLDLGVVPSRVRRDPRVVVRVRDLDLVSTVVDFQSLRGNKVNAWPRLEVQRDRLTVLLHNACVVLRQGVLDRYEYLRGRLSLDVLPEVKEGYHVDIRRAFQTGSTDERAGWKYVESFHLVFKQLGDPVSSSRGDRAQVATDSDATQELIKRR